MGKLSNIPYFRLLNCFLKWVPKYGQNTKKYKYSYKNKGITKYKNFFNYRIIGMGGSSLGAKAIYNFLKHKIKKNFYFIDNLKNEKKNR